MSDKKPKISKEDSDLFRSQVKGITPLSSDRVMHKKTPPKASKQSYNNDSNATADLQSFAIDDNFELSPIDANSNLYFSHPGLQHKESKRLKRGDFKIEARLDLHGLTIAPAKQKLINFIDSSQQADKRCVLLIHGRGLGANTGKAILKSAINHWLPQCSAVMAFCSAVPKDGGLGAVYILLRRRSR